MGVGRGILIVLAFGSGCRDRRDTPKSRDDVASRADAEPAPLTLGNGHVLRYGRARLADRQLVVRMTDKPVPCGFSVDDGASASLSFEIQPGPGARFYAGAPVGVRAYGLVDGTRVDYSAGDVVVEIEPFSLAIGVRVRGKLDMPHAGGAFEAEVCALESTADPLPEAVPDQAASGTVDGRTFRVKKALIQLAGGDGEPTRLEDLRLFQDASVICGDLRASKSPALFFHFIGGAGSRRPLVGSAQPAWASAFNVPVDRSPVVARLPSWVRFDRLAFEAGAKITGAVVVEQRAMGEPPTRVAGHFEAEVCPR